MAPTGKTTRFLRALGTAAQGYASGMRALGVLAVAAVLTLATGSTTRAESGQETSLRVAYWEDGSSTAPNEVWTLRCNPPRGTLPRPAVACRKLAAGGPKLFAPLPPNVACTQIYGGPQKARVVGTVAGKRVWTTFARTDGCQIARWNRLSPWLLPSGGARADSRRR